MFIILVLFLDLIEIVKFIQFFSYVPFVLLQERGETVHIVSMQKNFHVECYKCEVIYLLGIIGEHYERSPLLTYSKLISFRLYSSISNTVAGICNIQRKLFTFLHSEQGFSQKLVVKNNDDTAEKKHFHSKLKNTNLTYL